MEVSKGKLRRINSGWERERKSFFEDREMEEEEVKRKRGMVWGNRG